MFTPGIAVLGLGGVGSHHKIGMSSLGIEINGLTSLELNRVDALVGLSDGDGLRLVGEVVKVVNTNGKRIAELGLDGEPLGGAILHITADAEASSGLGVVHRDVVHLLGVDGEDVNVAIEIATDDEVLEHGSETQGGFVHRPLAYFKVHGGLTKVAHLVEDVHEIVSIIILSFEERGEDTARDDTKTVLKRSEGDEVVDGLGDQIQLFRRVVGVKKLMNHGAERKHTW